MDIVKDDHWNKLLKTTSLQRDIKTRNKPVIPKSDKVDKTLFQGKAMSIYGLLKAIEVLGKQTQKNNFLLKCSPKKLF